MNVFLIVCFTIVGVVIWIGLIRLFIRHILSKSL